MSTIFHSCLVNFSKISNLVKILTMDNLRNPGLLMMDWCHMYKNNGESLDHILLRCEVAKMLGGDF